MIKPHETGCRFHLFVFIAQVAVGIISLIYRLVILDIISYYIKNHNGTRSSLLGDKRALLYNLTKQTLTEHSQVLPNHVT